MLVIIDFLKSRLANVRDPLIKEDSALKCFLLIASHTVFQMVFSRDFWLEKMLEM